MRVALVVTCMAVGFLSGACAAPVPEGPSLTYSVGGCDEESQSTRATTEGGVQIAGEGDAIHVEHHLTYVCCAELVVTMKQRGDRIEILESNVGEVCRCLCDYEVEAHITGLNPGVYQVEVWGVEYQDVHAPELLGQASIAL
jgi:hypothetical protein